MRHGFNDDTQLCDLRAVFFHRKLHGPTVPTALIKRLETSGRQRVHRTDEDDRANPFRHLFVIHQKDSSDG